MASWLAARHGRCTAYGPGRAGAAHVEWEAILSSAVVAQQSTMRKMANSIAPGVQPSCETVSSGASSASSGQTSRHQNTCRLSKIRPIDLRNKSSCVSLSMVHITQPALIDTAICYEVFYPFDNPLAA
jgi:hypothetical protein